MTHKHWYQVRWNAERADNISVADLEEAYAYVWKEVGDAPGIPIDGNTVTIEDMVTGVQYHVPDSVLEYERAPGWTALSEVWASMEAVAQRAQAGEDGS